MGKASVSRYCQCMYFSSGALARKIEKLANAAWKPVGLSPSHAYLLMMVIDEPGIHPSALVESLLLTPSTITRLADKLEDKKLLTRATDGKEVNIFPTSRAISLKPKLEACLKVFYESYADILGREESARLIKSLNKITDKLDV